MSHTIQTAIAFPVVFAGIVALMTYGPILYEETVDAALFQVEAIHLSQDNNEIYSVNSLHLDSESYDIVCTSPERMHCIIRAFKDSARILAEGVLS